jgi:hypothetical protein
VALWLLVAQFLLLATGTLGHSHDTSRHAPAANTCVDASAPLIAVLDLSAPAAPVDCPICDAAGGTVIHFVAAPGFVPALLLAQQAATSVRLTASRTVHRSHSPRAPPIG